MLKPGCWARIAATTASFSIGLKLQVEYTILPPSLAN